MIVFAETIMQHIMRNDEGPENTKHSVTTFAITRLSISETAQETCCIAVSINMKTTISDN